jgi:DNA-binding CsgD family transcriptional regulator
MSEADLLERDHELSTLAGLLLSVGEAQGRLALVSGPAGIGKSRLLEAGVGRAGDAGALVLSARGSELERDFPFGVVRQLFEPMLLAPADRERLLSGGAAPARSVFEPLEDGMTDPSFAALHGLYWLTANLATERPLVLAIDDLHWCDRSSLRFIAYLARRLGGLQVLAIATLRPAEPGVDAALMGEVSSDPDTVTLEPQPLTPAAVAAMVRARLGAGAAEVFCDACHHATGGNPLLLRELLSALEGEGVAPDAASADVVRSIGPRAASRAVLVRLARLPEEAIAVARAVAVLGDGTDLAAVATLAELPEGDVATATAALAQVEILRPDTPLGFIHPLVRGAVYQDIAPGERELQHARAAQQLADAQAPPDQVAAHMLAMPRRGDGWVVDTLAAAARGALGRGAAESAVTYLRRALEEPPGDERRIELLTSLGLAEALTSGPAAAEHLRAAYDALPDPVGRAQLAVLLAETLTFTGRFHESAALAREAQEALGDDHEDVRQRLEVSRGLNAHFDPSADPEAAEPVDPGSVVAEGVGGQLLLALSAFDRARSGGSADEATGLLDRAIGGSAFADALANAGVFALIVFILTHADRPEALTVCDAALSDAHRRGSLFAACSAHIFRGYVLIHRGELDEAEDLLLTGFEEVEAWGIEPGRSHGSAFLSDLYLERGDVTAARRAFERAGIPEEPPRMTFLVWWLTSRVRLLLAEGRHQEALARAYDVRDRLAGTIENVAFAPWRSQAAEALAGLGRRKEAAEIAAEEVELARAWGAPRALGRALRVLGSVHPGDGFDELEEAVQVLEKSQARVEHARALAAYGSALRRDRRALEAREPLRRALDIAGRCDARGLVEHVRTEIYATGARPRSEIQAGPGALTASERRVVYLAAEGRDNRDIAQALYVTPKTIDVHLNNAFRKLGVRSRRELSGALAQA